MNKQTIRGELAIKRRELSDKEVADKSQVVTKRLIDLVDWSKVHKSHCYAPFAHANEVDTRELIQWMQQKGIEVTIPGVAVTTEELETSYDLIVVPILA